MINYNKLMNQDPMSYGEMTNSIGQNIEFIEHPTQGDGTFIICVCHELELAAYSDFFETEEMEEVGGDYEPVFIEGEFKHGL